MNKSTLPLATPIPIDAILPAGLNVASPNERLLCARLSVFTGGWTEAAAQAVCSGAGVGSSEVATLLSGLVATGVVSRSVMHDDGGEEAYRYQMVEAVQRYAHRYLLTGEEAHEWHCRHRDYFLQMAEAVAPHLRESDQKKWLGRLDVDYDNLRDAFFWSLAQNFLIDTRSALRLCAALRHFWMARGEYRAEGRSWCAAALSATGTIVSSRQAPERAKVLETLGTLLTLHSDFAGAKRLLNEGLAISREQGDAPTTAMILNSLGILAIEQDEWRTAQEFFEESLSLRRILVDDWGISRCLSGLGRVATAQGNYMAARAYYEESLMLRERAGDWYGIAESLNNLGGVAHDAGDFALTRSYFQQGLAIRRQLGDMAGVAASLNNLGNVAYAQQDYEAAYTYLEESIRIKRELNNRKGIAVSLINLGATVKGMGNFALARTYYTESILIAEELSDRPTLILTLDSFAGLVVEEAIENAHAGNPVNAPLLQDATRILATTQQWRDESGIYLTNPNTTDYEEAIANLRSCLGETVFQSAYDEGRAMPFATAVALVKKHLESDNAPEAGTSRVNH